MAKNPQHIPSPSYEDIIDNLDYGVVCVDTSLVVTVFNHSAEKMVGVSRSQAIGHETTEVFKNDPWFTDLLKRTLTDGKIFSDCEGMLKRRLPPPQPVGVTTSRVFTPEGDLSGAVALVKDITGIKALEEKSERKERLAYIGAIATNLAHEVKNPLSGIKGSAQLLERRLDDDSLKEFTGIIVKESDRLDSIVRDMLDFARPRTIKKQEVNIHKVLDDVLGLISIEGGEAKEETGGTPVKMLKEYDPSLPPVIGDEDRLKQVFLNLIKNAREALTGAAGEVRVSTRMVTDFHISHEGSGSAKFVSIDVTDSGCGIPRENLEKIFTPFFTTKSGGSGLGMAISYRIIKEHEGYLKVDSEPKRGTRVSVYLPIAGKENQMDKRLG